MMVFAINILLFLLVLGVWLWMDNRKKSKQKDVVVDAEDSCTSGYRFFLLAVSTFFDICSCNSPVVYNHVELLRR